MDCRRATSPTLALMALLLLPSTRCQTTPAPAEAATRATPRVAELDVSGMQKLVMAHNKVVLLMHATGCERAAEFAPTLERIARDVPSLTFGRIDVEADEKAAVATGKGVSKGAPALRAFFRNAPPSRRVLEYRGPPTFDAVVEWAKAVDTWDGGDSAPAGWQEGRGGDDLEDTGSQKQEL